MKKYIPLLKETRLFAGINENDIHTMLECLQAELMTYPKEACILRQGGTLHHILLLAEGKLHIQKDDYWGNRSIINIIHAGEMFGESYAASENGAVLSDVIATEPSAVISFDIKKLLTACPSACPFHARLIQNLFFVISEKNRKLVQKLDHMSRRTTREKLISYLSAEARTQGRNPFRIPFNRQQLADFLSVDRSALSAELGKMREEGLLSFHKNKFQLY